jgi:hypothetical protein
MEWNHSKISISFNIYQTLVQLAAACGGLANAFEHQQYSKPLKELALEIGLLRQQGQRRKVVFA